MNGYNRRAHVNTSNCEWFNVGVAVLEINTYVNDLTGLKVGVTHRFPCNAGWCSHAAYSQLW